ncbi:phosphatase PAP2/dual specificity phosphatase family protein [Aquimarina addita]|uniref:Phosphatase PAP2/dual specificity phosphatase family protein n=1 Tax=Aquimarina addita TaxID=870485 RepID=A0ABP6UK33_9FLAO
MDATRLSVRKKIKAALITSLFFGVIYNFAAWYSSTLSYVPSFVFSIEKYIPFLPWTIIPYMTSGIFFSTIFFFCKKEEQLITLSKRLLFVILVAGIFYFLVPLKFSLVKPETNNLWFQFLFDFIKNVDSPYNQAPSLHISFAFVFWTVFRDFKKKWRILIAFWLILLGLSTLTTYQHHVIDMVTAAILAQFTLIIFPIHQNNFQLRNFHIANYYFLGGWITILLSLLLTEFINGLCIILLWPSLVIFLVGYYYQKNHVHFLKDRSGNIAWFKKIFYFPYIMIYWFFWKFLRKNKETIEILPKIYISSKLDKEEIQNFNFNQNTVVYDFSAELEEHTGIKENSKYFCVPILDIGAFDSVNVRKIVLGISGNYEQLPPEGRILIHCTMGFTRSTFIGILVVKNILSLSTEEAVTKVESAHKHAVIPNYLQNFLKTFDI